MLVAFNAFLSLLFMSIVLYSLDFICVADLDYEDVDISLTFGQGSSNRQCFNIVILDDTIFEGEENFILALDSDNTTVATTNTTVFIREDDGMIFKGFISSIIEWLLIILQLVDLESHFLLVLL